jgi:hypothetical protein
MDQYEDSFPGANGTACERWCTPITVGEGAQRCVRIRADGTVTLHLNPDIHAPENVNANIFYSVDSNTWGGTYNQNEEAPFLSYCGPTAGKNFLYWYGIDHGIDDPSYATLGAQMKTDKWDGGLVAAASIGACTFLFIPDPICIAAVDAGLNSTLNDLGTLPGDLGNALNGYVPPGYSSQGIQQVNSLDAIRASLESGDPVIYLESEQGSQMHWAVITGIEVSPDGTQWMIVANTDDRQWSQFQHDMSLQNVGDGFVRGALSTLGLNPYTTYRWSR